MLILYFYKAAVFTVVPNFTVTPVTPGIVENNQILTDHSWWKKKKMHQQRAKDRYLNKEDETCQSCSDQVNHPKM